MKNCLPSLAAALLLISISPVAAIPIYGSFSGAVTGTGGGLVTFPVGTLVTGGYFYDSDQPSWSNFHVNIDGQSFAGWNVPLSGLSLALDANGIPVYAAGAGSWDFYLSGENLSMNTFGDNYVWAHLDYDTPAVPDSAPTLFLMAVTLSGLLVLRRLIEFQPRFQNDRQWIAQFFHRVR